MKAPARRLHTVRGELELGGRPWLMGIVNATPDSFSDDARPRTLADRLALAEELLHAGAEVIDVGGESGVTNRPAVDAQEETDRVVPVIAGIRARSDVLISIDTYKPSVAREAISAGADIVNDVSGLRDPGLAEVCAQTGAGLVLMHTRAAPKQKLLDPSLDGTVLDDMLEFLAERIRLAVSHGVKPDQLVLDPGPDFGKTPAQSVEVLRGLESLHQFERPLLLPVSRKDFIGAITGRPPRERLAGTLAAVAHGVDCGVHILRVHDVADVSDYLTVRSALLGETEVGSDLRLAETLRWQSAQPTDRAAR